MDTALNSTEDVKLFTFTENKAYKIVKEIVYMLLAFFVPLLILCILFRSLGFSPFKKDGLTIVSFDMQSEYIAYMNYYRNILVNGGSLIYTQGKVFGGDFLSIFTFYLASPFNLLVVFFQPENIPDFFLITAMLKMCFASFNFYLFARFHYKKCSLSHILFAIGYGLCSYSMIYISNFMWLDGVMILPLIILGLFFIKEEKHYWLYPFGVFYGLMTTWYIGFILCVFIVLFFLYVFFADNRKWKEKKTYFINTIILSVIGGMMASVLWFAAFLHFSGTKATQSFPNFSNLTIATFFTGFLENNYTTPQEIQQYFGYASMFTGVVSLVFCLRYFLNPGYTRRERIASLIFSFVMFLFVTNSILNALFHGGREPTWFPVRYSFVICFLTCYFASKDIDQYDKSKWYAFLLPLVVSAIVLPLVLYTDNSNSFKGYENFTRYTFSLPSLLIYLSATVLSGIPPFLKMIKCLEGKGKIMEGILTLSLIPLACYSSYRGENNILSKNIEHDQFQEMSTYQEDLALAPVFNAVKTYDSNQNYRMESTFNRPGNYNEIDNNPLLFSYSGLNHFSSNEKKVVEEYFEKLGFHYNYFFERYDGGSTLAMNSFLNLKYLIDNDSSSTNKPIFMKNTNSNNFFHKIDIDNAVEGYTYYQNDKALPYGFVIDDDSYTYVSEGRRREDGSVYYYDHFEYQNEMYKTMVSTVVDENGEKKDIFHSLPLTIVDSSSFTYTVDEDGFYHITAKKGASIRFKFTISDEAIGNNFYFYDKNATTAYRTYLDNRYYENHSYWHEGIRGFEDNSTHTHTLTYTLTSDIEDKLFRPFAYYEDLTILAEYLDTLRATSCSDLVNDSSLLSFSYKGTLNIKEGTENKTLLFTLPSERGISIYIDGKKQKVVTRMNIFSAVDFSSLSVGEHKIEIRYTDLGFVIGAVMSIMSLSGLVVFIYLDYRKKKKSLQ